MGLWDIFNNYKDKVVRNFQTNPGKPIVDAGVDLAKDIWNTGGKIAKGTLGMPSGIQNSLTQLQKSLPSLGTMVRAQGPISPLPSATPTPQPMPSVLPQKPFTLPDLRLPGLTMSGATPTPSPTITPKPTVTPTPIPSGTNRLEPYPVGPGTPNRAELYPKLQAKEYGINPDIWDAVLNSNMTDYQKRLALALAWQESSGGQTPVGDNGRSFGPYHMMPGNTPPVKSGWRPTESETKDAKVATDFLKQYFDFNELKTPQTGLLRRWNYNSGYKNKGPKYDVDLPRAATMSSMFRRNK